MRGHRFKDYEPEENKGKADFDSLFKIFKQLLSHTSGEVNEALAWMNELDQQHGITDEEYGMGDFIEDLKKRGYIKEDNNPEGSGGRRMTSKMELNIRQSALEEIFGKLKKQRKGNHSTHFSGNVGERMPNSRPYQFGDTMDSISMTDSLRNAQINHGIQDFFLSEDDLEIQESEFKTQTSTVLMIDISHSMILYGEDRITPAKKVAMALAELITTRYPKDTLDIIVFGNDAWQIEIKDLPYLQVGPYHTNTIAGLELAMDLLRRRKNQNKQIFMITDGKPTCMKDGLRYYKNSWGLDRKILSKTLTLAKQCRKNKIPVTTFMIASDSYLKKFVREFTQVNGGKAYYSDLDNLGSFIFEDYEKNRRKNVR